MKTLTLAIITLIGTLALPSHADIDFFFAKKRAAADRIKAIAHAKQIMLATLEFEMEYGTRPGELAAKEIEGAKAVTANDCFRQTLLALPTVRTEAIFYAPSKISKKPDNDIGHKANNFLQACAKGEVGFLYVDAPDSKDGAPLAAAPLLDGKSATFDPKKYNGKAVVLMTDGSVHSLDIDPKTGKVMIMVNSKKVDLFSKDNPQFRTPPSIKYPEPKEDKAKEEAKQEAKK